MDTRFCLLCAKEFKPRENAAKGKAQVYCGRKCQVKAWGEKRTKERRQGERRQGQKNAASKK